MATSSEGTRVVLNVRNIHCGHCVKTITRELKRVQGVQSVEASLERRQVAVEYTGDALPEIKAALNEIGYPIVE